MKNFITTLIFSEYFLELRRKLTHIVFGMTVLMAYFGYWYANVKQVFILRAALLLLYILLTNKSIVRNLFYSLSEFSKKLFERKSANFSGIGGLMLLFGCYIPIMCDCCDEVVMIVIITLSIGDGFATVVGKYLGKYAISISRSRSIFGTLGGLVAALSVSAVLIESFDTKLILACFVGIVIELLVGLLPQKVSEFIARYSFDNVLMPIGMIMFLHFGV